ncbi:MAG: hypothetical protein HY912_09990 [Desulfomonile tiedjei]|uniref:Uncharacterized protein n=1 Tax=Desulfomonile tiedjei TaxID=2358 RepID=A0A9D6V0H7_9BACT|nr:hypothetical protein [Desulfomonile tiedjei]
MIRLGFLSRWGGGSAAVLAFLLTIMCVPETLMAAGTPVPGYSGWTYLDSGGSTWYFYDNYSRFSYNNSTDKWYAYDQYGKKWQTLSAAGASSSYIFDGKAHDLINGWKYVYSNSAQTGNWARTDTGAARFAYNFATGRWYDYDPYGGPTWRLLSSGGRSGYFLGNGALNDLGNGWKLVYGYTADTGNWARSDTGAARFAYNFTNGLWSHYNPYGSPWLTLSSSGQSAAFVGGGTLNYIGNSWMFVYGYAGDTGNWARSYTGAARFAFQYGTGQWFDYGTAWTKLGSTKNSSSFIGDGAWHQVSTYWEFSYDCILVVGAIMEYGNWRRHSDQALRFMYDYRSISGRWWQRSAHDSSWQAVTDLYQSSSFIGDGQPHSTLYTYDNGVWTYTYNVSTDSAVWSANGFAFQYTYGSGQWDWEGGNWSSWMLGTALGSGFIGDSAQHDLKNGWTFDFGIYSLEYGNWEAGGSFIRGGNERFLLLSSFTSGGTNIQYWNARDDIPCGMGGFSDVGTTWLWDGGIHGANSGEWRFKYDYANDELAFYAQVPGTPSASSATSFLRYSWGTHAWYDRLAIAFSTWGHIAVGDDTNPEIWRTYFDGSTFSTGAPGSGEHIWIDVTYTGPSETITKDSAPGQRWVYTYGDGTWKYFDGTYWTTLATGVDPNWAR